MLNALQVAKPYHDLVTSIMKDQGIETLSPEVRIRVAPSLVQEYKILDNILFLPTMKKIRQNLNLLPQLVARTTTFLTLQNKSELTNWTNIKEQHLYNELDTIEAINKLHAYDKLACDIESDNLSLYDNRLLAIGFAYSPTECITICNFTPAVLDALRTLFLNKSISFIWANGKFDITRLKTMVDIDARVDEDIQLQHHAAISSTRGQQALKVMAPNYLAAPQWDDELNEYKKKYCRNNKITLKNFSYGMLPSDILLPYLSLDVIATFRLHILFNKIMRKKARPIYEKLIEASAAFAEIQLKGMAVDQEYINKLHDDLKARTEKIKETLDQLTYQYWDEEMYRAETGAKSSSETLKITSPKQLKYFYASNGINMSSTGADVLEKTLKSLKRVKDNGYGTNEPLQIDHFIEITSLILEFRKLQKQFKTYVVGLKKHIAADGRIHSTFKLHGTETGRLSSAEPNLHNIPRDKSIKHIFMAEKGKVLLQLDYSQAELRVLALLSGDPWLRQVYIDGKDLHSAVAEEMFGPHFTKEERVIAKTINFGIAYGRGPESIAEAQNISFTEARHFIEKWFEPMPLVKAFLDAQRNKPLRGEPCITPLYRQRDFIITDKNRWHVMNEAVNFPIQSVASDMTLISLIKIHKYLKENVPSAHIVNTVHDSIIIETPVEFVNEITAVSKQVMAQTPVEYLQSDVPFKADAEVGTYWDKLQEVS